MKRDGLRASFFLPLLNNVLEGLKKDGTFINLFYIARILKQLTKFKEVEVL